ncbi:MAG: flagellar hook-length control protein FliK [Chromatiales bacterium]|nr:flagellar hook-length control protein FliK [Chromatiales bacterium]
MQISDLVAIKPTPQLSAEELKTQVLANLRAGQVLIAKVEAATINNQATLRIGTNQVTVKTTLPLNSGENLTLNVVKTGEQPEFQRVRPDDAERIKANALRDILPKQAPVAKLIGKLNALINTPPGGGNTKLPVLPTALQTTLTAQPKLDGAPQSNTPLPINQKPPIAINIGPPTPAQLKPLINLLTTSKPIQPPSAPPRFDLQALTAALQATDKPLINQAAITKSAILLSTQPPAPAMPLTLTSQSQSATLLPASVANPLPSTAMPQQTELAITKSPFETHVINEIKTVLSQITLDEKGISPERLRQTLELSGLFLESKLALGTPPTTDLKSSLLRLLFSIKNPASATTTQAAQAQAHAAMGAPKGLATELINQLEGALARVSMNQLASVPSEAENRQVWQYEIPLQHREETSSIMVRIEREAKPGTPPEHAAWKVDLNFNLEPIGPMHVKLGLLQDEISSHFIAERKQSSKLIELALPKLDAAFVRAGLRVKKLSVRQGNATPPTLTPNIAHRIVDEKA